MKRKDIKIGNLYILQNTEKDNSNNETEVFYPVVVTAIDYDMSEDDECIFFEGQIIGSTSADYLFEKI